ncbi:MAG: HAMP domain-containing histidine kinase [Dysgonamonadaceae bacterium]|jgi:signal transduction histidine kinase|nr:HAMP domain-containing histidine kinase [Dysgonamonadaceae bacterium]
MKTFNCLQIVWTTVVITAASCTGKSAHQDIYDNNYDSLVAVAKQNMEQNPDTAIVILKSLLDYQILKQNEINQISLKNLIGTTYDVKGTYDSASFYLLDALKSIENKNNDSIKCSILTYLGIMYFNLKDAPKSLEYYRKAIPSAEKLTTKIPLIHLYNNIGNSYMTLMAQFDSAKVYLQKMIDLSMEENYEQGYTVGVVNICQIYNEEGNTDLALKEVLKFYDQWDSNYYINFTAAECYLKKGETATALTIFKNMLKLKLNTQELKLTLLDNVAAIYKDEHNPDSAFYYLDQFYALRDSIHSIEKDKTISELEIKYETEKKEFEIVRQKNMRKIFTGGLIITGLLVILLYYIAGLRKRRNRALEEMNTTKDKFFSIISHDLKNPAIAQRDAIQLLLDYSDEWNADSLQIYYSELLKSANNQVELLYNLLNWAQVQTGRIACNLTTFNLIHELHRDMLLIQNMAEQKGIEFNVVMPEKALVTGDSNMLTIVIRNLLTNAVKFTETGGTVSLSLALSSGGKYIIAVSDTGRGMSREQLQTLFRVDRRHTLAGTAGEQGTGLGLIVCKELVEKQGSTLHIESEEGKGSRFWFAI